MFGCLCLKSDFNIIDMCILIGVYKFDFESTHFVKLILIKNRFGIM